ncbi:MAG: ABC transporter [Clostridiales bacterium]|nr:MAG: ABC transporter [Clostridiales bacterium]
MKTHSKELIRITNLNKQYDDTRILENVNFSLRQSEIVAIMGYSGAGKTTFLNILLGLDKNYSGEYIANFKRMPCVFQEDRLLPWLNVYDNIKLVNKSVEEKEMREILKILNLQNYQHFYPSELSGGMRQRTAIARALAFRGDIIVMDEPLKSTDQALSEVILDYLKERVVRKKTAIVIATHDIENARRISDRMLFLKGKPASFVAEKDANEARLNQAIPQRT